MFPTDAEEDGEETMQFAYRHPDTLHHALSFDAKLLQAREPSGASLSRRRDAPTQLVPISTLTCMGRMIAALSSRPRLSCGKL
jgi:hypothetical protein